MCVIIAVGTGAQDLTDDEWEQAFELHDDGYGVAWFEDNKVRYIKRTGQAEDLKSFRPPKPYVMHFRMATQGDAITKLCHPFVIGRGSPLRKKGSAKKVLFHNGHVTQWEDMLIKATRGTLPKGPYSDSRAVALAVHAFGPNILTMPSLSQERFLIMDAEKYELEMYGGWEQDKDDCIWRSNTWHLWNATYGYYDGYGNEYGYGSGGGGYGDPNVCMETGCRRPTDEDSFIYCTEHKADKYLGTTHSTTDMYCKFCGTLLSNPESIRDLICLNCKEALCIQCAKPLTTQHLHDRRVFCDKCQDSLDNYKCIECGLALEVDSPFKKCEDCISIGGF